jgi:hypothetical protein
LASEREVERNSLLRATALARVPTLLALPVQKYKCQRGGDWRADFAEILQALTSLDQAKNDAKKNQADLEEEHKKKLAALQREKEGVHAELSQANASIKRLQGLAKEEV